MAIDFDGTLASYHGWQGPENIGKPLKGSLEFLNNLLKAGYRVVIFSTRDVKDIRQWLRYYLGEEARRVAVTNQKPSAWVFIDDRALTFKGKYPGIEEIESFKPHWEVSEQRCEEQE